MAHTNSFGEGKLMTQCWEQGPGKKLLLGSVLAGKGLGDESAKCFVS